MKKNVRPHLDPNCRCSPCQSFDGQREDDERCYFCPHPAFDHSTRGLGICLAPDCGCTSFVPY